MIAIMTMRVVKDLTGNDRHGQHLAAARLRVPGITVTRNPDHAARQARRWSGINAGMLQHVQTRLPDIQVPMPTFVLPFFYIRVLGSRASVSRVTRLPLPPRSCCCRIRVLTLKTLKPLKFLKS